MISDLENLLQKLSDEAKANVLQKVAFDRRKYEGKFFVFDRTFGWAVTYFEKQDELEKAAELAEKTGFIERAVELYKKAGDLHNAAWTATRGGMHTEAISIMEEDGNLFTAGEWANEAGLYDLAANYYVRCGEYFIAGDALMKIGLKEDAKKLHVKALHKLREEGEQLKAARLAKRNGLEDWAEVIYGEAIAKCEEEKELDCAGVVANECGRYVEASKFFEKAGNYKRAGQAAKQAGNEERAKELYAKAFDKQLSDGPFWANHLQICAQLAENAGMEEKAKELWGQYAEKELAERSSVSCAITYFIKAGNMDKAQELFYSNLEGWIEQEDFRTAAENAQELGLPEEEDLFDRFYTYCEKKMDFRSAWATARRAGHEDRLEVYEKLRDLLENK